MNSAYSIIASAVILSGCAHDQGVVHHPEYYDVVLSPHAPANKKDAIRLVSISRSGRVTIRDERRTYSARVGQFFVARNGYYSHYYLTSVDPDSGLVVVRGEMRIYTSF